MTSRKPLDATAVDLLSKGVSYAALKTTLCLEGREDLHQVVVEDGFLNAFEMPNNYVFVNSDKQDLLFNLFLKECLLCKTINAWSMSIATSVKAISEGWDTSYFRSRNDIFIDCIFIPDFYSTSVVDKSSPFNASQRMYIEDRLLHMASMGSAFVLYIDDKKEGVIRNWYSKRFCDRILAGATIL